MTLDILKHGKGKKNVRKIELAAGRDIFKYSLKLPELELSKSFKTF